MKSLNPAARKWSSAQPRAGSSPSPWLFTGHISASTNSIISCSHSPFMPRLWSQIPKSIYQIHENVPLCPRGGGFLGGNWGTNKLSCWLIISSQRQTSAALGSQVACDRCQPQSCSQQSQCLECKGNITLCFLALPGQCFSRIPGGWGSSSSVPIKEAQTLFCIIFFSKTTHLGG